MPAEKPETVPTEGGWRAESSRYAPRTTHHAFRWSNWVQVPLWVGTYQQLQRRQTEAPGQRQVRRTSISFSSLSKRSMCLPTYLTCVNLTPKRLVKIKKKKEEEKRKEKSLHSLTLYRGTYSLRFEVSVV